MDCEVFLTPKRAKKVIIPERDSRRRRSLFESDVEDDITPLSPTSSEISSPPGTLTPLLKCSVNGVTELTGDTGVIPVKNFYGVTTSPVHDGKSLLDRVKKSLPDSHQKIRMRLSFDEEPIERKKRSRSAGHGDSVKRVAKKQKLSYVPYEQPNARKKQSPKDSKFKTKQPKKKITYNWELFGTPSNKFFRCKPSCVELTPPQSGKKKKVTLLPKDVDFLTTPSTEDKDQASDKDKASDEESEIESKIQDKVNFLLDHLDEEILDKGSDEKENTPEKRLFPIFVTPVSSKQQQSSPMTPLSSRVHKMGLGENQLQLDVGQNQLREVECSGCGLLYCQGQPEDEINHNRYHNRLGVFSFKGWKDERVVGESGLNRIICVMKSDHKSKWTKALQVINYVDNELGFPEEGVKPDQIYLYVSSKLVLGVIGCIHTREGFRLLDTGINDSELGVCSLETYKVWCGISRMWVDPKHRKQGIATAMLDAVRRNFIFSMILTKDQIAFSSPTMDGKHFAEGYCKRKDFIIYQ